MIFRSLGFTALVVSALALGACSTVTNPGAPDQSFDIDNDLQELEEEFKKGPTIKDFYAQPNREWTRPVHFAEADADEYPVH